MKFVDSWRLFGPNLQTRGPATLAEVSFDAGEDVQAGVDAWRGELSRIAAEVGLPIDDAAARVYRGGAVLTFPAAIDVLLAATDVNEWAAQSATSITQGAGPLPLEPQRTAIEAAFASQRNATLLGLEAEAARRQVPLTWDDEGVTLGAGKRARTWQANALPALDAVPWDEVAAIPVALVTGTNGKTTSVRLLARMLKNGGHLVGMTTTDGVWVNEDLVEGGDFTGPAGATQVLRHPRVDAAVLETARGGILRRGLVVRAPDVALLTNVSEDHLGHYGIDDLDALARVKAVVGSVVPPSGWVVVNADDRHLMTHAASFVAPLVLFSLDAASAVVAAHRAKGGEAWFLRGNQIVRAEGGTETVVASVSDVPIAFGGAAPYNVANAMGAAAAARALGVKDDAIQRALRGFGPESSIDNPGRGNLLFVNDVTVLVDFAHNPDAIRNVLALATKLLSNWDGARLFVVAGYAGDRSDESLRDAARAVFEAKPTWVGLRDLQGYLRGRAEYEVPRLFQAELVRLGLARENTYIAESEGLALERALALAGEGDVVVILAHLESAQVRAVIADAKSEA